jgi:hypothetical protein
MSFNISSFVDDLVPNHINQDYPELVEFIKVYALYLEKENKSAFYLNQVDHQRDIDLIEEHLLTELQHEIGAPIPRDFAADPRLFYKHLVEFYRSRGTPESIKAFFKLIYNDEVDIHFPREDMLIPSDGKWFEQKADIIANVGDYSPAYTWTLTTDTFIINMDSDQGFAPKFDDDVIFVNGVYVYNGAYKETVYYDDTSNTIKYSLIFTNELLVGDVVTVYPRGLFTTADGFLSNKKYIQDSYFYQKFSYVLKTGKNIDDWKNAFTRLIHPAGFIFFGEILIFIDSLTAEDKWILGPANNPNFGYQGSGLPININISPVSIQPSANELGTYVEKEFTYVASGARIGMWNHLENTKFWNWRPIAEYSEYTLQDVINNNIGLQLGARIWSCTPNDPSTDTSYDSNDCTIQT